MHMKKRLLAGLLVMVMVLTQVPAGVYAEVTPATQTDTVKASTKSASQELQERIDILPLVEEFQKIDSNKQNEIYNEAESIADEYDKLSENDKSLIDIERLEDLFVYINGQISETQNEVEQEASVVSFKNDGYPYGKDMTSSQVTLVIDVDGTASSYQWQSAESKDGEYTDIDGATEAVYTLEGDSLVYGTWYRCVVDGKESKAVETVKPDYYQEGYNGYYKDLEDRIWTKPYAIDLKSYWYISNGKMAYMANAYMFDVTGLYEKNNQKYMLNTSYDKTWIMYSNESATPSEDDNHAAQLKNLRVAFNDNDDYDVIFEADLADGQRSFSFGCDTQLGNESTSGSYSDKAPLKAIFKNKKFFQVSMIGAESFNTAKDDDPAFVIAPITDNSIFWLGKFNNRIPYSYNTRDASDDNYMIKDIDGQNVVTLLEGIDSGMTMSWLNLESGSSVKFRFCVGDVKDTGAVNGKVDYSKEKIIGLEKNTDYIVTIEGEEGTKYNVTSDENGELSLVGTDKAEKSYDFIGKNINIVKADNPDSAMDLEISGRPDTPQNPSELEGDSDSNNPELDQNIEIKDMTKDSVTIAPRKGQQYAYSTDGTNWTVLDDTYKEEVSHNTYYKIQGLSASSKVYIKTRVNSTNNKPASEWSEVTELTLKETIEAEVKDYRDTYDGKEHSITVTPTNVEGADIKYSLTKDGEYSSDIPKQKDATTSRDASMNNTVEVYYRIEKEGYYPLCGSAVIIIWQKQLTLTWSDTTLTYDGTAKLPTAVVSDGLLEGDEGTLSVYTPYSYIDAGEYYAYTKYSNSNYTTSGESKKFTIEKADREAPVLNGISESVLGMNDGKIEGLTSEMEYRKVTDDDSENPDEYVYTEVSDENMLFESGTYAVRYKESRNYKESAETKVTINKGRNYIMVSFPSKEDQKGYTITNIGDKDRADLNEKATFKFKFELEPGYNKTDDFNITVNGTTVDLNEDGTFTFTKEKDYNMDLVIKVAGVADTTPPTGEIILGDISPWKTFLSNITFNHFFKDRQQVVITAEDNIGVQSIEYYVFKSTDNNKELSSDAIKSLEDSKWEKGTEAAKAEFFIDPDIRCIIYARITDNAGNKTYISSEGLVLDNTAPVITGIENGGTYCQDLDITVEDDNIASVVYKVDDKDEVELTASSDGKYTLPVAGNVDNEHNEPVNIIVTATDKSGNATSISIKAAHQFELEQAVPASVLYKGYDLYKCKGCEDVYNIVCKENEPALGEEGLVPNKKEELTKLRKDAQTIIENDVTSPFEEDKDFYVNLIAKIDSMLKDIQNAENTINAINSMNLYNPTINDVESLNEAISMIDALLDADNKETPSQSLTDAQKEQLGRKKEVIRYKLALIAKANEALKAVKEGTETEAGVDTINKIENIQPSDQDKIESVLDRLLDVANEYQLYFTKEQYNDVDEVYYNQMLDKLKDAACKDIDSKLDDALRQIEISISDTQEKENAINKAKQAAGSAKEDICYYENKEAVVVYREDGKKALDNITGNIADYRNAVKSNIERIIKGKQDEIESMTDLTEEQKNGALSKLEADKNNAFEAIEGTESKNDIVDVFDDVNVKFSDVVSKYAETDFSNAKDKAKKDIAIKAEDIKKAIEAMPHLTDEEKAAAKKQAEDEVKTATEAIDNIKEAAAKSEVDSKKADAIKELDKIEELTANNNLDNLKAAVKSDIDSRAGEAKSYIDSLADLTVEEKTSYKEAVEVKAEEVKTSVDAITDSSKLEEVKALKGTAEADIKKIEEEAAGKDLSNAKDKAKNEIATRAEDVKKAIETMPHLTDEEKAAAKKQAEEAVKTATDAIDKIENAADKSEVGSKKADGIKELDKIEELTTNNNLDNLKAAVKSDIDSRAGEAKNYIDSLADLTVEEKTSYKEAVEAKAEEVKTSVDAITDSSKLEEVKAKKETAETDIKKIEEEAAAKDLSNVKAKAWDEIEKQYKNDVAYIESLTDLTDEEMTDYSNKIIGNAMVAYIGIEKAATSRSDIEKYKTEYNEATEKLKEEAAKKNLTSAKKKAQDEIAKKSEDTKKAIDAMSELSDEKKSAAKKNIDDVNGKALEEINAITDVNKKSEINSKKTDTLEKLEAIEESAAGDNLDNLKAAAKTDVNSEAEKIKEAIGNLKDLTEAEKIAMKDDVDKKAEEAGNAIEAVTDPANREDVLKIKKTVSEELEKELEAAKAKDFSNAKDMAKAEIKVKADDAKKAIDAMPNLTTEQKEDAKNKIDELLKETEESINNITDDSNKSAVSAAKEGCIYKFEIVEENYANNDFDNLKEAAKSNIDSEAEAAKKSIDNMADLTAEDKEAAKAKIDKKAEAAKKSVDAITDSSKKDDIKSEKESVIADIKKQQDETAAKNEANAKENAIKAEEAAKKALEIIHGIKLNTTDEESIKSQIKEVLEKSNLKNVDVDVNEFKKVPATLHESGRITGKVEVKAGGTTKVVEINQELPALSSYVNYESVVESGAPEADVSVDKKALMDNILSAKAIEDLSKGSNADIILSIQNKQAEATDADIEAIAGILSDNAKIGRYFDISLYMNVTAEDGTPIIYNEKIHEAGTMFTIKVNVPKDLWANGDINRTYQIIRVHDGAAEILDSVYDESEHTLTFMTDRFSTYAIIYSDVEKNADSVISDKNDNNGSTDISKDSAADSDITAGETSTATGDMNHAGVWVLLMALAAVGIFMVSKKKKYIK